MHIDELLKTAVQKEASDIHLSEASPPIFRIHGNLVRFGDTPLTGEQTEEMAKYLLGNRWETFEKEREYDFAYEIPGVSRFRLNIFHQKRAISIAARVISDKVPTIDQLDLPPILKEIMNRPHGLVLVTGPAGSGKSTTLAAMIDFVNQTMEKHIITLEDPIEYIHNHAQSIVQQREVGIDTKQFSNGLRAALRQDPDVILVGEMRDLETIRTAITAAETGQLVLATLHTNSAAQTITRIIDVFPPHQQEQIRIQLSSVLEAVISQRLLKRSDKPGRIAATEILIRHPSIANLIRNNKIDQIHNVLQTSKALGMHTLQMSIRDLLNRGIISHEQAKPFFSTVGDFDGNV